MTGERETDIMLLHKRHKRCVLFEAFFMKNDITPKEFSVSRAKKRKKETKNAGIRNREDSLFVGQGVPANGME